METVAAEIAKIIAYVFVVLFSAFLVMTFFNQLSFTNIVLTYLDAVNILVIANLIGIVFNYRWFSDS